MPSDTYPVTGVGPINAATTVRKTRLTFYCNTPKVTWSIIAQADRGTGEIFRLHTGPLILPTESVVGANAYVTLVVTEIDQTVDQTTPFVQVNYNPA